MKKATETTNRRRKSSIQTRVRPELKDDIQSYADSEGVSLYEYVEAVLEDHIRRINADH